MIKFLATLRHFLTASAGFIAALGLQDNADALSSFLDSTEAFVVAAMVFLGGLAASFQDKSKRLPKKRTGRLPSVLFSVIALLMITMAMPSCKSTESLPITPVLVKIAVYEAAKSDPEFVEGIVALVEALEAQAVDLMPSTSSVAIA